MSARHFAKPQGGRPRKEDEEANEAFNERLLELHEAGCNAREIAAHFKIHTSTAWRRIQKARWAREAKEYACDQK